MSNTSSPSYWTYKASAINRYFPVPLLILGTFGNILNNILIFARKTLRKNSCVQYLLSSSIVSVFTLYIGLMSRLLNGYNLDYTSYSSTLCKIRYFISYLCLYCTSWFITLGCFDRFCSSSVSVFLRNFCKQKIVYRAISAVIILGCFIFAETIYCFNNGNFNSVASCYTISVQCQVIDGLLLMIFYTTIPIVLMITFDFLTLKNIRQSRRQVRSVKTEQILDTSMIQNVSSKANTKIRKKDLQIITMLLVQVGTIIIFSSPMGFYKFYASLTAHTEKSLQHKEIENFVAQFVILITYINNSMMFFIYTLTGHIFRQELFKLIFK
ncbi:unnamed protein product [Adineta ricciae]|uniref:G-protein coupled receptors family 1 profile domain-containing protein n=1 Tax=Adineta ricciae TaxID=249248 RepID=A0A815ZA26_ADIRI|nr:unnamed protein product [Adineta ricciae]